MQSCLLTKNKQTKKKTQTRQLMAEMVKSMLCFRVKLCALTFRRGKLDVTLHSIQNINLSPHIAVTYSVIQPTDYKRNIKSLASLPPPTCNLMTMSAWEWFFWKVNYVHVNKTVLKRHEDTHKQTHQWGLCRANHRLSLWMMLHCLVPHNYIHNNPEPLRSLTAKSCVPLWNIQTLFQNTHNWLKCNQLSETIKVCFKINR